MPRRSKSWFDRSHFSLSRKRSTTFECQYSGGQSLASTVDTNQVDLVHGEGSQSPEVPRAARAGASKNGYASDQESEISRKSRKGQLKVVDLPQHLCPRPRSEDDDRPDLSEPRFGSLRFPSSRSTTKPTKWVCIGPSTEHKHVNAITELIFHTWNLAPPPVVLSIVGATRQLADHSTPADVRHAFLRGLRSAAAKTHAWVFTTGTNSGASAIAGEALRQESEETGVSHVVMGFAPWRRVHLHDKIEQHKKAMVLDYNVDEDEQRKYASAWDAKKQRLHENHEKKRLFERVMIEPNHTHMILVDDGIDSQGPTRRSHWGCEKQVRSQLELALEGDYGVPMVVIMFNGGYRAVDMALESLRSGRRLLVIGDSNGAAGDLYKLCHPDTATSPSPPDQDTSGRFATMNVERAEYNEALRAIKDEFWRPDDTRCMIDFFLVLEHDLSEDDYIRANAQTPAEELCDKILNIILLRQSPQNRLLKAVEWGDLTVIRRQLDYTQRSDVGRALERSLMLAAEAKSAREAAYLRVAGMLLDLQDARASYISLDRLFVDKFNTFDIDGFCEEHDVTSTRAKLPRRHGQSSAGNDESTRALLFLSKYLVNSGYDTYLESRGKLIAHEAAMMYKSQRTWAAVVLQRRFRLFKQGRAASQDQTLTNLTSACRSTSDNARRDDATRSLASAAVMLRKEKLALREDSMINNRSDVHEVVKKEWRSLRDPGREVTGRRRDSIMAISKQLDMPGSRSVAHHAFARVKKQVSTQFASWYPRLPNAATMPIEDGLRFVQPNWMDLAVWSTLVGRVDLTRLLWEKTSEPVRTGLVLSRLVQRLNYLGEREGRASIDVSHLIFESWSKEVIDEMDFATARSVLTGVKEVLPATTNGEKAQLAWAHSAIDEAVDVGGTGYECMSFLSHPHCTRLITAYFNGDCADSMYHLVGPHGRPPSVLSIVLHVATFGIFLLCMSEQQDSAVGWRWFSAFHCRLRKSKSYMLALRQRRGPGTETLDTADTCAVTDEALDADYITVEGGDRKAQNWQDRRSYVRSLDSGADPLSKFGYEVTHAVHRSRRAVAAHVAASVSQHQLLLWLVFWRVPLVRYVSQTILDFIVVLFLWMLLSESSGWPYMYVPPYSEPRNTTTYNLHLVREFFIWTYIMLRGLEQLAMPIRAAINRRRRMQAAADLLTGKPFIRIKDLSALWCALDITMMCLTVWCVALRVIIWIDTANATDDHTFPSDDTMYYCRWLIEMSAILAVLASIRFLEAFCFIGKIGETLTMVLKMVLSLIPVFVIITILSLGFGAAFMGILSTGKVTDPTQSAYWSDGPLLIPWWVLVGSFDKEELISRLDPAQHRAHSGALDRSQLAAILFWVYSFLMNVILLNLLIAQMTSAYESVKDSSREYRLLQRAKQALEYKDVRDAFPLFSILRSCLKAAAKPLFKCMQCYHSSATVSFIYHQKQRGFLAALPPQEFLRLSLEVRAAKQKAAVKRSTQEQKEEDNPSKGGRASSALLKKLNDSLSDRVSHMLKEFEGRLEQRFETALGNGMSRSQPS